jgi:hypothetical protein
LVGVTVDERQGGGLVLAWSAAVMQEWVFADVRNISRPPAIRTRR